MLFAWFMLTGFIFFFTPQKLTNKFQFAFARIFSLPLSIGRNFMLSVRTQQSFPDVVGFKESQYQNYIANLEEQLRQKHEKIEMLSGLRNRLYALEGARLMPADVITASVDGLHNKLIINRGKSDGLAKGQFVLGDNSIIGTISEVSFRTAQVKLVTDPASKIAVKIGELNAERLMQGKGNNCAKVQLLSIKHKVRTGDIVYASKKPGYLDVPMIAGTVARCKRDDENPSVWDITVKPACDIEGLSRIAVIIMNPQE